MAESYSMATGLCALADDSGLEVDALGGAPGLRSARYAGEAAPDDVRINLLLSQLSKTHDKKRRAHFICVIAIANLQVINVAEGRCEGSIANSPRGEKGFGFDPIFIPQGYDSTFGELPFEVKNRISHRSQALVATRQFLHRWLDEAG